MRTVTVIGGGASGLLAAIIAARRGACVRIIERQSRVGKKLLVTGNGRCNLTSTSMEPERFHSSTSTMYYRPIEKIDEKKVIAFFEELGMLPLVEEQKVYPLSGQAASIVDLLRLEVQRLGIEVCLDEKVVSIKPVEKGFKIKSEKKAMWHSEKVIVATGGLAAPQLGCDETGYKLLTQLGHTKTKTFPTLVHIISPTPYCKMMQGTRMNVEASIYVDGKHKRVEQGEILFTEDGLSGPVIFQLSRIAAKAYIEKQDAKITLDLFPEWSKEKLIELFYKRLSLSEHKTVEEMFLGWLHKRVVIPVIKEADIGSPVAPCENLDYEMIIRLIEALKALPFKVEGTRNYKFAQSTAGGISLDEVNLETMESLKVKGLYITGEVLDVDGDCGGYNLQWAWSTGYIAGEQASK